MLSLDLLGTGCRREHLAGLHSRMLSLNLLGTGCNRENLWQLCIHALLSLGLLGTGCSRENLWQVSIHALLSLGLLGTGCNRKNLWQLCIHAVLSLDPLGTATTENLWQVCIMHSQQKGLYFCVRGYLYGINKVDEMIQCNFLGIHWSNRWQTKQSPSLSKCAVTVPTH